MAFITEEELRPYLKSFAADDQARRQTACEVGCRMVESGWDDARGHHPGIGPVLYAERANVRVMGGVANERIRSLTTLSTVGGSALTLSDYYVPAISADIPGQVILRSDGRRAGDLIASYATGYAAEGEAAPEWIKAPALHLAAWYFNMRPRPGQQATESEGIKTLMEAAEMLSSAQLFEWGFA